MARVVITGGAGFVGSHICDALVGRGDTVVCVDNLLTGRRENITQLLDHERFTFIDSDVVHAIPVDGAVDLVMHLASPASPPEYLRLPFETLDVSSIGTRRWCEPAAPYPADSGWLSPPTIPCLRSASIISPVSPNS